MEPAIKSEELPKLKEAIDKASSNGGVLTPSETELVVKAANKYFQDRMYWDKLFSGDTMCIDLQSKYRSDEPEARV